MRHKKTPGRVLGVARGSTLASEPRAEVALRAGVDDDDRLAAGRSDTLQGVATRQVFESGELIATDEPVVIHVEQTAVVENDDPLAGVEAVELAVARGAVWIDGRAVIR